MAKVAKDLHDPIVNAVPTAEKEHIQMHKVQRVAPGADGMVKLQEAHGALKTVDVADVDLVLGFADGTFIIIPNGALDAIAGTPGKVAFTDGDVVDMGDLFKLVGHVDAADAGSLRIISENINTKLASTGESDEESDVTSILLSLSQHSASTAPPAPLPKASSLSAASPIAKGSGNGRFDTEALDSIVPPRIDQPTQYRVGVKVQDIKDLNIGLPTLTGQLYVADEYKVSPSFRSDLPVGATDATSTAQATREVINASSAGDTINNNSNFAADGFWSKTLHLDVSGFGDLQTFTLEKPNTPGLNFNITDVFGASGTVTTDPSNPNKWIITIASGIQENGIDLNVVYSLNGAPVNFFLQATATGTSGAINIEKIGQFYFSYKDAQTAADYEGLDIFGQPIFVIPSTGVGYNIYGNDGNDVINAGAGYDSVFGGSGDDILHGERGDDTLVGGLGADVLDGGVGNDTASYRSAGPGLVVSMTNPLDGTGEAAGDTFIDIENLEGSEVNADVLIGNSDANRIFGLGGNDTLEGMAGADTLDGGTGTNTLSFQHAGGDVTATLTNGLAGVTSSGDAANDVYLNLQNIIGSTHNDYLIGSSVANVIEGGAGNDTLEGINGGDILNGGADTDTVSYLHAGGVVTASLNNNTGAIAGGLADTYINVENLQGSAFNDALTGSASANSLSGEAGDDTLEGLGGSDTLSGGDGIDTASYANAADLGGGTGVVASMTNGLSGVTTTGDAAGDVYLDIETLQGSAFKDYLIGNALANTLLGGNGDDTLEGLGGADTLNGGAGNDTATYIHGTVPVVASLTAGLSGVVISGDAAGDVYSSIENLTGTAQGDRLIGDSNINILTGDAGDDTLEGLGGSDVLIGGTGVNTASYEHANAGVVATLTVLPGVTAIGDAAGDSYTDIQNLLGSSYADILIGNGFNNTLTGGLGNDTLEGLGGADSLDGGAGIDTASYAHAADLGGGAGVVATMTTGLSGVTTTGDAAGDSYTDIEVLEGSAFNDYLIGNSLANTLLGGDGNDTLEGLGGNDTLNGGSGSDTATYIHGTAGVVATLTTGFSDVVTSNDAQNDVYISIENLTGTNAADLLIGDSNINILTGGTGNDTLEGLGGADVLDGGADTDTASYAHANTAVTASLSSGLGVTNTGDAAGDTYISIENLLGSANNDVLIGNSAINSIIGGLGNDTLEGMDGADSLDGGAGNNTASYEHAGILTNVGIGVTANLSAAIAVTNTGDAAGDTYANIQNLTGSQFADILIGDVAANVLSGGAGNDTLEGLVGSDTLNGGDGNDTATYEHAAGSVNASLTSGVGTNTGEAQGDVYISIENLTGSASADILIGNSDANILSGGDGNDTLEGLGGADSLVGGLGINTASYDHASSGVVAALAPVSGVSNSGDAAGDVYTDIQNLLGSAYADVLIGNGGDNSIAGGVGNDTLEGMAGADSLDGGAGIDTASYAHAVDAGGGLGIVASMTATFVVGPPVTATGDAFGDVYTSIEVLEGSAFRDYLIGDSTNNILSGGSGDDTLEGLGGNDTLNGGDGNDTATYVHATGSIAASLVSGLVTATGDAIGDVYNSIENLTGSNYADTLIGDNNVNILSGGDADDKLEGLGGADSLDGGNGNDTASYLNATGAVVASMTTTFTAGPAVITAGDATGDTYSSIEILEGSIYNDVLIGSNLADTLLGGNGNDTLEGMNGADSLNGGAGTDTASYAHATDLGGGAGVVASMTTGLSGVTTTGDAAGDSYASIEVLEGSSFNDYLIGDATANTLLGGDGNDTLEGLAGNDTLNGGNGNDTATYIHATTAIVASLTTGLVTASGIDAIGDSYISIENLTGSNNADQLIGNSGINILTGGDGNDTLEGMGDADVLDGGNGNNTASYEHAGGLVVATLTAGLSGVTVTGDAVGDTYINIQNLYGSAYNDRLIGNGGVNILTSGGGADTLEGLGGADSLVGSVGGNDTASYEHATGVVLNGTGIVALLSTVTGVTATGDAFGDTYTSIENLIGSIGNDQLIGDNNGNRLEGNDGNDTLEGLNGADALIGGNGTDTATYIHSTTGVIASMTTGLVTTTSHAQGDTYSSIEILEGSNFDDQLIGDITANTLNGGSGDDTLEGMGGADVLNGGAGVNIASYEHASIGLTAVLDAAAALAVTGVAVTATGDAAGDTYTNIQNLRGSSFADRLVGDTNANAIYGGDSGDILEGLDGNDSLYGEAGDDTLVGGTGTDTLDGGSGTDIASYRYSTAITVSLINPGNNTGEAIGDTYVSIEGLEGGIGADSLTGNDSSNTLLGGDGNDTLEGLGGADIINGGIGNDTASYANAGVAVVASLTIGLSGVVNAGDAVGDTFISIENLQGSALADLLVGDTGANVISGADGNDTLEGIGGVSGGDTLAGGNGIDTASYIHATGSVTASLLTTAFNGIVANTGTIAGFNTDTFTSIENLIGSNQNDILVSRDRTVATTGTVGTKLEGGSGNDTLVSSNRTGAVGVDTLDGGTGIDTVSFERLTTGVTVILNNVGTGTALSNGITDQLVSIENLVGTAVADSFTLGVLPNGSNGGAVDGGAGVDTVFYNVGSTIVNANLQTGVVNGQAGILTNIENLTGANGNDTLTGDGNDNILIGGVGVDSLIGGGGDDILEGGAGADYQDGGTGINTARYTSAVTVSLNTTLSGTANAGDAIGDTLVNIQNLTVTAGNSSLFGDNNANYLTGGTGNDILEGFGGNDILNGGTGTNTATYIHATNGVYANLNAVTTGGIAATTATDAPAGTSIGTDTLLNIQNLTGSGFSDLMYGDGNNNVLVGNDGNDTMDGGAGNDNITGGNGNDSITGGLGIDTLDGGANDDFIDARLGKDVVTGGAGNDTILGSVDAAGGTGFPNRFTSIDSGAGTDTLVLSGFTNNLSYALSTLTGLVTNTEAINIQGDAGTVTTTFALDSASIQSVVGAGTGSTLFVTHGAEDGISIITTGTQSFTSTVINPNDTLYTIYSGAGGTGTAVANVHWMT